MCIFFFNDTATTEIYTLSLHDALPIWLLALEGEPAARLVELVGREPEVEEHRGGPLDAGADRKSTRLNSRHANISYAVFCLKKKSNITYLRNSSKAD